MPASPLCVHIRALLIDPSGTASRQITGHAPRSRRSRRLYIFICPSNCSSQPPLSFSAASNSEGDSCLRPNRDGGGFLHLFPKLWRFKRTGGGVALQQRTQTKALREPEALRTRFRVCRPCSDSSFIVVHHRAKEARRSQAGGSPTRKRERSLGASPIGGVGHGTRATFGNPRHWNWCLRMRAVRVVSSAVPQGRWGGLNWGSARAFGH